MYLKWKGIFFLEILIWKLFCKSVNSLKEGWIGKSEDNDAVVCNTALVYFVKPHRV